MKKTRKRYSPAAKVVTVVGTAALFAAGLALAAGTTVTLGPSGPQPATVTVQWGDTVTFANADDSMHGITIPRIALTSPPIPAGGSWPFVFDGRTGSYFFRQTEGRSYLGSIVVQLKGSVTMKATPAVATYGKRVSFAGTALPGFPVKLERLVEAQAGQWVELLTVRAGPNGTWSASLVPKLGARYRATAAAGQLRSQAVSVDVQPAMRLVAPRGAAFRKQVIVRASIAPPRAATTADLERYDRTRRRWVREDRQRVDRAGKVSFSWRAVRGRSQLRVQLPRFALRPGFAPAASKPVSITVP